jgi:hypothetical protein
MSDELKSVREILEELAAGDDRLRESFPKWLEERDRQKRPPKKPPGSETKDQVIPQIRPRSSQP